MSHGGLRLRLRFDDDIHSDAFKQLGRRIMYQPSIQAPDIAGLASLIQHDFGIEPAGCGLELYTDVWRLPLCSSSAVLRDGDVLTVSRSSGSEPQLQLLRGCPWQKQHAPMLAIAAMPHAQEVSAAVKGHATDGLAGQQAAQKKRKQDESEAPAGTGALQAKAAAPDADSSEETSASESGETASSEEEQAQKPGKGPSRNARRKKHKRQLRRLGLLGRKPAGSLGNLGRQMEQQRPPAPPPQAADSARDGDKTPAKRRKVEAVKERLLEASPEVARASHTNLPRRGEQWRQSADVAVFLQKGHVHFADSDEEADMPEVPETSSQRAWGQEGQTVAAIGGYAAYVPKEMPGQAHSAQQGQQRREAQQPQQEKRVDYERMPRPSPYPLEGDIIAYRLLHIGADWSPQVSDWREGRVVSLDTAEQNITVEPCTHAKARHQNGQAGDGGMEFEEEDEEEPPTEYDEDGVLRTSLHSFSDVRIIVAMAADPSAPGPRERRRSSRDTPRHAQDGAQGPDQLPGITQGSGGSPEAPGMQPSDSRNLEQPAQQPIDHLQQASGRAAPVEQPGEGKELQGPAAGSPLPAERVTGSPEAQAGKQTAARQVPAPAHPGPRQPVASQQRPHPVHTGSAAAPATANMPASVLEPPVYSPLGPPMPVGRASPALMRSPAAFAEAAAALKRRRAELAAARPQQRLASPSNRGAQQHQAVSRTPTSAHAPQTPQLHLAQDVQPEGAAAPEVVTAAQSGTCSKASDNEAAKRQQAVVSEKMPAAAATPGISARAKDTAAASPLQQPGVRTRSSVRANAVTSAPEVPCSAEADGHGTASVSSHSAQPAANIALEKEGLPGGSSGEAHVKRARGGSRGSLIGPLLARLRREEESHAEEGHDAGLER